MQVGVANILTWAMLCFQCHTDRLLQHSKASRYFQTVAELRFSVHDLCPSKPCPFAQIKIDASAHARIFTARKYTFGNRSFKLLNASMSLAVILFIVLPFRSDVGIKMESV